MKQANREKDKTIAKLKQEKVQKEKEQKEKEQKEKDREEVNCS